MGAGRWQRSGRWRVLRLLPWAPGGPSILKTLRFNLRYFGWEGVRHRPVTVSRQACLVWMGGAVEVADVRRTGAVRLGFGHTTPFDRSRQAMLWGNTGTVVFRGTARIEHSSRLIVHQGGTLDIGDAVFVNGATIVCRRAITVGATTGLGWGSTVLDTDLHPIYEHEGGPRVNDDAPVVLGFHVWIGTGAYVLRGADLPDQSIVSPGSVVGGAYPHDGTVLVGNPARVVRTGAFWET